MAHHALRGGAAQRTQKACFVKKEANRELLFPGEGRSRFARKQFAIGISTSFRKSTFVAY